MYTEELLTTAQAAELTGLTQATVRSWKHRGHLAPAGLDEHGRPLYRLLDVAHAERHTRPHAGRRHPAAAPCPGPSPRGFDEHHTPDHRVHQTA